MKNMIIKIKSNYSFVDVKVIDVNASDALRGRLQVNDNSNDNIFF